jgi:hypothetical protein
MKYFVTILVTLLATIGLKQVAHAENSVNISNNTNTGSNTHIVVNSNVNSSTTNTSTINSNTKVHIETNGEVKDFNTSGDESVDWQSTDGKSSVKINNNAKVTSKPTEDKPSATPTQSTASAQQQETEHKKPSTTHSFSLSDFFKSIFSIFGFSK